MELRGRDYEGEESAYSLPRVSTTTTHDHPLIISRQDDIEDNGKIGFCDPLRRPTADLEDYNVDPNVHTRVGILGDEQLSAKEWSSFKRTLMQNFSATKIVSVSSMSDVIIKSGRANEKSLTILHLEGMDNLQNLTEDRVPVITQQDYAARLRELKVEIDHAWKADDRVKSLKLSIKVARLLMDTSVSEFYPALFILVTDVMDMLGDMVWERIKTKAEYGDDGTRICSLQEDFHTNDICSDAKETCYNWFCKIGCISELLPRIYLELAILRCWRFLHEQPWRNLHRLVMMIRGLADPLASFYCRLYMVSCAQKLPPLDTGYLLACICDIKIILSNIISTKEPTLKNSQENKKLLISVLEPTVEWIMKCISKDLNKKRNFGDIITKLQLGTELSKSSESSQSISVILHHFLKELPAETVCSHSLTIVQLIESANDISLNQYINYRLLGLKLSEQKPQVDCVDPVVDKVFQVITQFESLDEYLAVVDAFLDIILQYHMDSYLTTILDGISVRVCSSDITEKELSSLQSIVIKLLTHFKNLSDVFGLNHFIEILHVMYGSSRDVVTMHILNEATRNGCIHDTTVIQLLFEISQALHEHIDILNIDDVYHKQQAHLICRFVQLVDYGAAVEHHLTFLVECRGAFGRIDELKEVLVHAINNLAVKAIKDPNKPVNFVKSCIAFNEITIPSIASPTERMNLYLETVEVALLGGLLSHADGLIDSVIGCLHSLDHSEGSLQRVLSLIRKLCSLLVIIPGNPEQGVGYYARHILALHESYSWTTPQLRLGLFCAILSLTATLSQHKLPYQAYNTEIVGNDLIFFGDLTYSQELTSISSSVLTMVIDVVVQEPHQVTRGNMALEACNSILSSFKATTEVSTICLKLIDIAKSSLNAYDNYLQSTVCCFNKRMSALPHGVHVVPI